MAKQPMIGTYTGKRFDPREFDEEYVDPRDIAHGLSLCCRYNGQCTTMYSVAEHCLRGSLIIGEDYALEFLLHDAAEAYLGDMIWPLKQFFPEFVELTDVYQDIIYETFGITERHHDIIKEMDDIMHATECRDIMHPDAIDSSNDLLRPPLEYKLVPLSPYEAEQKYLKRFEQLICRQGTPGGDE